MRVYKTPAKWIDCPGVVSDGAAGHAMRDGCSSCAPFWARIPLCPSEAHPETVTRKLTTSGWCRGCRKHFDAVNDTRDVEVADAIEYLVNPVE